MPPNLNILCLIAASAYGVSILVRLRNSLRSRTIALLESVTLTVYLSFLHRWTGFPYSQIPFSASVGFGFLLLLLIAVISGILSSQVYHTDPSHRPNGYEIARPVMVAPLLLLPLLASLDSCGERTSLQNASFLLLAFQNGFFWRSLFARIKAQEEQA